MPVTRPDPPTRIEVLDLTAVAERCHVSKYTPQQWRQRNVLPPVDFPEILTPLWRVSTIHRWAHDTDRDFEVRPGDVLPGVVFNTIPNDATAEAVPALAFSAPG